MPSRRWPVAPLRAEGLYDPAFEHDSCGVGFVANLNRVRTHGVVSKALTILDNLVHRGAIGGDGATGDGAGLLFQVPHEFFLKQSGISLPGPGEYGVGMVFMPRDLAFREEAREIMEEKAGEQDLRVLGWRTVPVESSCLGEIARSTEPAVEQVFLSQQGADAGTLQRNLYVYRRVCEKAVWARFRVDYNTFYICSLSATTLVYMRGNVDRMKSREATMTSDLFGDDLQKLFPIIIPDMSDSSQLDNVLELLTFGGRSLSAHYLINYYHAICLAGGAESPRRLDVPGVDLDGVHLAMDYLTQQNRRCDGDRLDPAEEISAKDKVCVVLGAGDTGADCVGTARRQGPRELHQFELLPKPPESRTRDMPWPSYPRIYQESPSHEEGCIQRWNVMTKKFTGENRKVSGLEAVEVDWSPPDEDGRRQVTERPGTGFQMSVDLVILALGFTGATRSGLLEDLGVQLDESGVVITDASHRTSTPGVFCAGDMELGASLVVSAIAAGQQAAESIDSMLARE